MKQYINSNVGIKFGDHCENKQKLNSRIITSFLKMFYFLFALGTIITILSSCDEKKTEPEPEVKSGTTGITTDVGVVINGVKWATCNVAAPGYFAISPESAGMFYQWNRKIGWNTTEPIGNTNGGKTWDETYSESTEWTEANDPSPAGWRVPTQTEIQSLYDSEKVTCVRTTTNAKNGIRFTDKSTGVSIFFPDLGYRASDGWLAPTGYASWYWSSTQYNSREVYCLESNETNNAYRISIYKGSGLCIRSVAKSSGGDNPNVPNMQNAVIKGSVSDANGNPLQGVKVTTGTESAVSVADGTFSFSKVAVVDNRAVLKF